MTRSIERQVPESVWIIPRKCDWSQRAKLGRTGTDWRCFRGPLYAHGETGAAIAPAGF